MQGTRKVTVEKAVYGWYARRMPFPMQDCCQAVTVMTHERRSVGARWASSCGLEARCQELRVAVSVESECCWVVG